MVHLPDVFAEHDAVLFFPVGDLADFPSENEFIALEAYMYILFVDLR